MLLVLTGCSTTPSTTDPSSAAPPESLTLVEGDAVRISFPGAPELNAVQQIRRDGMITLPMVGEIKASGFTLPELEKEVLKAFGDQLVTKQVVVSLESGAYHVYVSGAVMRPGKFTSDRPMTALQAVMEAGGFDQSRANTKAVRIIRHEGGKVRQMVLNLQAMLDGRDDKPFYLKAADILVVPEKFTWF
jgi:polysaccharide export outer membrane protein